MFYIPLLIFDFIHLILHLLSILNICRFGDKGPENQLITFRFYFMSDLISGTLSILYLRKYYSKFLYFLILPYLLFHIDANLYFWNFKYLVLNNDFWDKIMNIASKHKNNVSLIYFFGVTDEIILRSIFIYHYIKIIINKKNSFIKNK